MTTSRINGRPASEIREELLKSGALRELTEDERAQLSRDQFLGFPSSTVMNFDSVGSNHVVDYTMSRWPSAPLPEDPEDRE